MPRLSFGADVVVRPPYTVGVRINSNQRKNFCQIWLQRTYCMALVDAHCTPTSPGDTQVALVSVLAFYRAYNNDAQSGALTDEQKLTGLCATGEIASSSNFVSCVPPCPLHLSLSAFRGTVGQTGISLTGTLLTLISRRRLTCRSGGRQI